MSAKAMSERAVATERQMLARGPDVRASGGSALDALLAYFPSEGVAVYVGLVGLAHTSDVLARWTLLSAAFGFNFLVSWYYLRREQQLRQTTVPIRKRALMISFSSASFLLWTTSIPGTPADEVWHQASRAAPVAAIVAAPSLFFLAQAFDLTPPWRIAT